MGYDVWFDNPSWASHAKKHSETAPFAGFSHVCARPRWEHVFSDLTEHSSSQTLFDHVICWWRDYFMNTHLPFILPHCKTPSPCLSKRLQFISLHKVNLIVPGFCQYTHWRKESEQKKTNWFFLCPLYIGLSINQTAFLLNTTSLRQTLGKIKHNMNLTNPGSKLLTSTSALFRLRVKYTCKNLWTL